MGEESDQAKPKGVAKEDFLTFTYSSTEVGSEYYANCFNSLCFLRTRTLILKGFLNWSKQTDLNRC